MRERCGRGTCQGASIAGAFAAKPGSLRRSAVPRRSRPTRGSDPLRRTCAIVRTAPIVVPGTTRGRSGLLPSLTTIESSGAIYARRAEEDRGKRRSPTHSQRLAACRRATGPRGCIGPSCARPSSPCLSSPATRKSSLSVADAADRSRCSAGAKAVLRQLDGGRGSRWRSSTGEPLEIQRVACC